MWFLVIGVLWRQLYRLGKSEFIHWKRLLSILGYLSDFSKCFCTESEASATENPHFLKWWDECDGFTVQWGFKPRLNSDKASGGCQGF